MPLDISPFIEYSNSEGQQEEISYQRNKIGCILQIGFFKLSTIYCKQPTSQRERY